MDRLNHHRDAVARLLDKYQASDPRLFGSVARGDASEGSDIDAIITIDADQTNPLMAVAGLSDGLSTLLDTPVDVVTPSLLRDAVAQSTVRDMVPL
jgi:predicted nucleotidyltransferase